MAFRNEITFFGEELCPRPTPPQMTDHPFRLSSTASSIHSHIWRPSPPSATRERTVPWQQ
jgi:hypothetical protein